MLEQQVKNEKFRAWLDREASPHRAADHAFAPGSRGPPALSQRAAFLKDVARRLHNVELGDGAVAQAAREAQAEIRKISPWLEA